MNIQSQQISPSINLSCLFFVFENDNFHSPLKYKALPHPRREKVNTLFLNSCYGNEHQQ